MAKNKNLHQAKRSKNDEFYTQLEDIEKELACYDVENFKGQVIYCPCDDYRLSNFVKCFKNNFEYLGLKKLIATNYDIGDGAWKYEYDGENETVIQLKGNGGYETEECIAFLKEADVVVTNPPFSLFRDYVKQLMDYNKKFLIIGNSNAITYKEIFPYLKDNKLWLGMNWVKEFIQPNGEIKKFGNICWFTNIENKKRNQPLDLYRKYNPTDYPKYDNYCAFNVDKVAEIPEDDYIDIEIDESELEDWIKAYGDDIEILEKKIRVHRPVWGTPITFLDKYNPKQFEIVWTTDRGGDGKLEHLKNNDWKGLWDSAFVNGSKVYKRIFIKKAS